MSGNYLAVISGFKFPERGCGQSRSNCVYSIFAFGQFVAFLIGDSSLKLGATII